MYTVILMSSRGNSVRQHAISKGHILFLTIAISVVFLAGIIGIGYGLFHKLHKAGAVKRLQTSMEKFEQLTQEKLQVESELAGINAEMADIRQMTEKIQQVLGILGQGGGYNEIIWTSEQPEGQANTQQENASPTRDTLPATSGTQVPLTPNMLKQEILPLYDYVSEHQNQLDGYPSILPVKLQQPNGEKHDFWYSSHFGRRIHPLTKRREFHQGLDIKTRAGVPIIAAADGVIVKIEKSRYLGNIIELSHESSQFKTLYAHLKGYADGLKPNQKVTRGQTIGYVGNTGRSTGAHLHYGIYDMKEKEWVNPINYILDQQPIFSP